jgi:multiple sugar transport system substrate-binding protein
MAIRILGPDDPALKALELHLEDNPKLDVTLEIIPWAAYRDTLMEVLQSGEADFQAVCVPGHIWLPELAAAGYLAPFEKLEISKYAALSYQAEDLMPKVAAESIYEGQRYLLPLFTDGHLLFYRSDLIEIGGGDTTLPTVHPMKLREMAEKAFTKNVHFGLALKAHPSEIFLDWLPFLWDAGGTLLDENGQAAFAGQEGVSALETYCQLKEFCPADTHNYGNAEIAEALKTGRVAMATSWGGQAADILLSLDNPYRDRIKVAIFPKPWDATWGITIPENQPQDIKNLTINTLMRTISSDLDSRVIKIAGSPVRKSSYQQNDVKLYRWLPAQYEMLNRAGMLPSDPRVGSILGFLYEAVYDAFVGSKTPSLALKFAAEQVNIKLHI